MIKPRLETAAPGHTRGDRCPRACSRLRLPRNASLTTAGSPLAWITPGQLHTWSALHQATRLPTPAVVNHSQTAQSRLFDVLTSCITLPYCAAARALTFVLPPPIPAPPPALGLPGMPGPAPSLFLPCPLPASQQCNAPDRHNTQQPCQSSQAIGSSADQPSLCRHHDRAQTQRHMRRARTVVNHAP